jgi:hypothetical protein
LPCANAKALSGLIINNLTISLTLIRGFGAGRI